MAKFIGVDRATGDPVESGCTKACCGIGDCQNKSCDECVLEGTDTVNKESTQDDSA